MDLYESKLGCVNPSCTSGITQYNGSVRGDAPHTSTVIAIACSSSDDSCQRAVGQAGYAQNRASKEVNMLDSS